MNLEIQRYDGLQRPQKEGEWVRYKDVVKLLSGALEKLCVPAPKSKKLLCSHRIEIQGTGGIASTYCMEELGHQGEHK